MKKVDEAKTKLNINNYKEVQKESGPFYFLMRFFKILFLIIMTLLLILLIIELIPKKEKMYFRYMLGKNIIHNNSNIKNDYSFQNIINSVNSNKYLDSENKKFIIESLRKEIEENYKYIDIRKCSQRLKTLKVNFESIKEDKQDSKGIHFAGNYNQFSNTIYIYDTKPNLSLENCNKQSYFHELNHLISTNSFKSFFEIDILSETLNEIFTREYFNEEINQELDGYDKLIDYAYAFAELLPDDTLRKYKFYEDENILIEALLEIDNNFDEVYKLLNSLNLENINNSNQDFYDSYNYFYERKYDKRIEEDEIYNLTQKKYFTQK